MPYKIFSISALDPESSILELNKFIEAHKVIEVQKEIMRLDSMVFWSFCIHYLQGSPPNKRNLKYPEKIDYKEVLSAGDFMKFSEFREIRKKIAKEEGLPAFAVFTDAELAALAKVEKLTATSILTVKGVGEKKASKYGSQFVQK